MSNLATASGSMRPPFLILTPACLLLGIGNTLHAGHSLDLLITALVIIAGLSAHASVNLFNEYSDFKSGLDLKTVRTPFSGGSGTLPSNPTLTKTVLALAIVTLLITIVSGLYLSWLRGWELLAMGLTGVILILFYTKWVNRWAWLCLIAPGLAFGPIMVVGTELALSGQISITGMVTSLVPFFVVNNLLLLNQVPDVEADKSVGRNHFPIRFGFQKTVIMHQIFSSLTVITLVAAYVYNLIPVLSLIALLPVAINLRSISEENLKPRMAFNVMTAITAPALTAGAMLF